MKDKILNFMIFVVVTFLFIQVVFLVINAYQTAQRNAALRATAAAAASAAAGTPDNYNSLSPDEILNYIDDYINGIVAQPNGAGSPPSDSGIELD